MRGDIDEVVDLHQVHALDAQAPERVLHLADARVAAAGPDLGGDEKPVAHAELGDQVAGDRLGRAVHGRRVHDIPVQELQHLPQGRTCGRIAADVEGLPGADTDGGKLFAGGRNCAHQEFRCCYVPR